MRAFGSLRGPGAGGGAKPPELPIGSVRQLLALRRDFLSYLRRAAELGDLVTLRPAPGVAITLVRRPDLVEELLVRQATKLRKSRMTHRMVHKFLGEGLVLAERDTHRQQRVRVQPALRASSLEGLAATLSGLAEEVAEGFDEQGELEVERATTRLSMRVIAEVLFGAPGGTSGAADLAAAMERFADSMASRFRSLPLPEALPTSRHRAERRAVQQLDAAIAARLASAPPGSLAARLVAAGAGPKELRDQLATLYFAGHETSAKGLAWALWLLASHPEVQDQAATDPALRRRVIAESLRLYPPTWLFDREATEPVQLDGYRFAPKTVFYLSPYLSHRDPRYFAEPDRFEPDRFLEGAERRWPRGAYFPFGFGPRNCVGRALAAQTAEVVLGTWLRTWRFEVPAEVRVTPEPAATLRPRGLQLKTSPR